ncbi:CoA ester lyase [Sulfurimonas sp. SAG-AH-194-I05]|nr:aldolase/citrate lyase family protein [Sulfurimonas sp. SAG-AH-194-I05]MDF1874887.1 CoA ester lyase [Sulfurimonas sp. SAG-AH-194-I05]
MKSIQSEAIIVAYENKDLQTLLCLTKPHARVQNKSQNYHSVLMLSCNKIQHLMKIESLQADCIMLNLEDGVSKQDKPFALVLCAFFLSKIQKSNKKIVVRVNALDEGGDEEIKYLNAFMPDAIRVPKIKNKKEVQNILDILHVDIELHLSIETAESWNNLATLALSKRVTTFYLGVLDLFADMQLPQSLIEKDNPTMLYILSHFLVTSKAMGIKPVSFVYQDFKNVDAFEQWISLEKKMGYDAKGCISPSQVKCVNQKFLDDTKDLEKAKKIIELFERNEKEGVTGFTHANFGFIDEPIYKGALALLRKNK